MSDDDESFQKAMKEFEKNNPELGKLLKKIHEKHEKKIEYILAEKEELEKKLKKQDNQAIDIDWNNLLIPLQSNFPIEWRVVAESLRKLFLKDRTDAFNRRTFQMALLGIISTQILKIPGIDLKKKRKHFEFLKSEVDLTDGNNTWLEMDDESKQEIIKWAIEFRASPNVKPEALVSGNLWGYILRKITMAIEEKCSYNHDEKSRIQLFGEFKTKTVEAIGANFFTDYVITAGCVGLPLFLAELESRGIANICRISNDKDEIHKDLKKLSVQMAGVLLELIGMIRKNSNNEFDISTLRSFGSLISDTQIEFFVSRPATFSDGKFVIVFESHPEKWRFDLYQDVGESYQDMEIENPQEYYESQSESEPEDLIVEIEIERNYSAEYEESILHQPIPISIEPPHIDYSKSIGSVNEHTLEVLANFLGRVHDYYGNLNEVLKNIYTSPENFETDTNLKYAKEIHEKFHTSSGPTPMLKQENFHGSASYLSIMDSYAEFEIPKQYIFTTLPSILHMKTSDENPRKKIVRYLQGLSLPEVESFLGQETDELESKRVYYRSCLILNIVMGIFMAAKAGIGFDLFTLDEITFRNGVFCIKTFTHSKPISNKFTVLDSVRHFRLFYSKIYFMDQIMMENDYEYRHLINIESIFFGRLANIETVPTEDDWIKIFKDAQTEFESILDELSWYKKYDSTLLLLENLVKSFQEPTTGLVLPQKLYKKQSLASSGSSSIETMAIADTNKPSSKVYESVINEEKEEEQSKT